MAYLPPPEEYAAGSEGTYDYMKMEMSSCFDPDLMDVWVLTELSHWDHEWERCVVLSEDYLYLAQYDFTNRSVKCLRKTIKLSNVKDITIGTMCYPEFTLSPRRCNLGIRINWGDKCDPCAKVYWNPASEKVPYVVLMSHPLSLYRKLPNGTKGRHFSIFDFAKTFLPLIKVSGLYNIPVYSAPICMETYLGLGSILYNAHEWGYDKQRKGYVGMWKCDPLIPDDDDEQEALMDDEVVDRSPPRRCSRDDSPPFITEPETVELLTACDRTKC
ncbi:unnamed protein product [Notodromas monacha]|uniref:Inositol phosphatase domain-containing protein n=1 Tax=Notodromas monacha TaxID=399045 RepID=A0A7R9BYH0_9CRUS|nr:unnamed protein product [Notodromas monacha]CAG0923706.1 unnamed protein product [Notodromas monacha]